MESVSTTSSLKSPLLIDTKAAAKLLGVEAGVVRTWVAEGLAFVRAGRGGRKMFAPRDLEKWVERRKEVLS